jgi:hypothetical protein
LFGGKLLDRAKFAGLPKAVIKRVGGKWKSCCRGLYQVSIAA